MRNGLSNISYPKSACIHKGFTLIELMVVLAIIGMVACIVGYSMRGMITSYSERASQERLLFLDKQCRSESERFGKPIELVINLDSQTIEKYRDGLYVKSDDLKVYSIRVGNQVSYSGEATIKYRVNGTTPSYVFQCSETKPDNWVLVLGGTGQSFENSNSKIDPEKLLSWSF